METKLLFCDCCGKSKILLIPAVFLDIFLQPNSRITRRTCIFFYHASKLFSEHFSKCTNTSVGVNICNVSECSSVCHNICLDWFMFRPSCFVVQGCLIVIFVTPLFVSSCSFIQVMGDAVLVLIAWPSFFSSHHCQLLWRHKGVPKPDGRGFSLQHVFDHIQGLLLAGHIKNTTPGRFLWDLNHLNWLLSLQRSNVVWVPPGSFAHISQFTTEHQKTCSVVFSSDFCSF